MTVTLNGEEKEIADSSSISGLIKELDLNEGHIVVELNGKIIDKNAYSETLINPGDKVEMLAFVGGG